MNERPHTSLFGELRRRKVLRAAIAYLAGAWVAIEVSDTVFPRLGLPDWSVTAVVWVAVVSFPMVVVLAWIYRLESGGLKRETWSDGRARVRGGRLLVGGLLVLTALLALGAWRVWLRTGWPDAPGLDRSRVAVLPFRTAGATPELATLREGMIVLLSTRLTGEVGPRAVDVRTVMSLWSRVAGSPDAELPQDSALLVSAMTGAATAVLGSVVVSGSTLTVAADVLPSDGDGDGVRVEASGPVDSPGLVVDRLAAELISAQSGGEASNLGPVLPAWDTLRLYLSGEAAYRRGDYGDAFADFSSALQLDSTFAMAALGVERSAPWTGGHEEERERARRLAWRYRDRLSRLDDTHLVARLGPNYPEHPTARELFDARQEALDLMPDRAEVWYEMGDVYFHWGYVLGETRPLERAGDYFERTLAMDDNFAAPLQHLILLAGLTGDRPALQELAGRAASGADSAGPVGRYARWRVALADADSAALARFWSRPRDLNEDELVFVVGDGVDSGLGVEQIHSALQSRADLPMPRSQRFLWLRNVHGVGLAAGRPAEAAHALDDLGELLGDRDVADRLAVTDALYSGGDSARAAAGVSALARRAAPDAVTDLRNRCVVAQWRLWRGEPVEDSPALAAELRSAAGSGRGIPGSLLAVCAELVDALAASGPDRVAALDRLESLLLAGPLTALIETEHPYYANLALAELREEAGDLEAALRAARRRPYFHGLIPEQAMFFLTQARLASRLGLREEAIDAYTRFLNLRSDPEPSRRASAQRARAALGDLMEER